MEQHVPLNAYASYPPQGYDYNVYTPSPQHINVAPSFSIPHLRSNHSQSYGRANTGYEPLSGASSAMHEPPPSTAKRSPGCFSSLKWWIPEIFAAFLATGAFAGIVVILRLYDGRILSDIDLPGSLTLNGIIALMSTVGRAALMVPVGSALSQESWIWFAKNARRQHQSRSRLKDLDISDSASRGAWGSLLFLFAAKRRWVAYIGVLVTILSLVFGTATQQLLGLDSFQVPSQNDRLAPGNLPRAETWQYFSGNPNQGRAVAPLSVRASMYNGILSKNIDPLVVNCPAGNCTWPTTPSLAVCGECSSSSYTQECDDTQCLYTMASGTEISLVNTGNQGIGFAVDSSSDGGIYSEAADDRLYLVHFDVIGAPYMSLSQGFHNQNTSASECALWMCIEAYNTSMASGTLHQETVMALSDLTQPPSTLVGAFSNYTFVDLPTEMNPSPGVTYNVSSIGASMLASSLQGLCNGTAFLDHEGSGAENDMVDAIWNASANLNPWIQNLARSLTNAIRYDDPDPTPPTRAAWWTPAPRRSHYDGHSRALGVKVRWYWIVVPLASVALSHLFLIIIMVQTARSAVAPWKSSLLTFLFFDVDRGLQQAAAGRVHRHDGVNKAVGSVKVVLSEDPEGRWAFKTA